MYEHVVYHLTEATWKILFTEKRLFRTVYWELLRYKPRYQTVPSEAEADQTHCSDTEQLDVRNSWNPKLRWQN